ncbi:MAG: glycosyltransferase family 39 protein [Fuerstiella sp.]
MNSSRLRHELVLVAMAMLLGIVMRFSHADRMAVEHFDEGVYTSNLWMSPTVADGYPSGQFFAPPGLPTAIEFFAWFAPQDIAPFLPALLLGSLMIPTAWLAARLWFGQVAGLMAAFLVAGSDYHIIFSRMALTDVPVLTLITLAVTAGSFAVQKQSSRWMIASGILTGLAWYTKYTGWLPVAILTAGTGLWWLLIGRRVVSIWIMFRLLAVLLVTVLVMWLPLNSWLAPVGGYSAVNANHSGYWSGWDGWQNRLVDHLIYHLNFDSLLSCGCLGLGMIAAATRRWIELKRSSMSRPDVADAVSVSFPSTVILVRLFGAAVVLAILASAVGSFLILLCVGIGGVGGLLLWPVLSDLHARRVTGDLSAEEGAAVGSFEADLQAAPIVDPTYGVCLVFAWFVGLLVTIPGYQAYPRLSLPLLAAVWLAASAGLAWWMEAVLNVARRVPTSDIVVSFRKRAIQRLTNVAVIVAIALVFSGAGSIRPTTIWQGRTSLRDASWKLAQIIQQDQSGTWVRPTKPMHVTETGLIRARAEPEYDQQGKLVPGPSEISELLEEVPEPMNRAEPVFDSDTIDVIVYGYGEPAVLKHLTDAGLLVNPVQTSEFVAASLKGRPLPTYFVLGPYALRSNGKQDESHFLHDWVWNQNRFEHVADVRFVVSDVVMYNLFPPTWIGGHPEAAVQRLELYRLK